MLAPIRLACVLAQNLPIQIERARRGDRAPLLIPHPLDGATVYAASSECLRAGVTVGMGLREARQMAPSAALAGPDEDLYHACHDSLRGALKTFSAAVETVALGEFLIDARGLERFHKDEDALARVLVEAAGLASGLAVQVGVANGRFPAQQAARRAPFHAAVVVPPGSEAGLLASLPVDSLPQLPPEARRRLMLLDIHTLGKLVTYRKPAVLRQFGAELSGLYELARGHDPRPLQPDAPPLRFVRSRTLADPLEDRQVLLNIVGHLGARLGRALTLRGYHAEALKLSLSAGRGGRQTLEAGRALKPPTADPAALSRLALQLFGRLGANAPVASLALCAYPVRSWHLDAHQLSLIQAGVPERRARLEDVLQIMIHRFGQEVVRLASFLGAPIPVKIDVRVNSRGLPALVTIAGRPLGVSGVSEYWREERLWWARPVRRDYYRALLSDDSVRNIFQDLISEDWFLDRAWPIL